jgi:hypothetical protein
VQLPLQPAVDSPLLLPNKPAAHCVHVPAFDKLYCPTGQMAAVEFNEPAAHAYPAVQLPLHVAIVKPADPPNEPAKQYPEQLEFVKPLVLPYSPAAHRLQTADPLTLYCPGLQMACVTLVEPSGQ